MATTVKFVEKVGLPVRLDFAKTGASTTAVDSITIPAGFVLTGVYTKEVAKTSANVALVLKAKTANVQLGANYTCGGAELAAAAYNAAIRTALKSGDSSPVDFVNEAEKFFASADTLTFATASSTFTAGVVDVVLVGYYPAQLIPATDAVYASAGDNKAPVDPYTPPEKQ